MKADPSGGRMPDFLVIGAGKSGTTSLHHYLSQHPDLFLASEPRESNFFALEGTEPDYRGPDGETPFVNKVSITTLEAYRKQFADAGGAIAVGEKCPLYLYHPDAADNVRRHVPGVKLLAILRNPVERAWSAYLHARRMGSEPLGFVEALAAEPDRIEANWGPLWRYRDMGFYHRQLARYDERFPEEAIRVWTFDDFRDDAGRVVTEMFRFIGVEPAFDPDRSRRLQPGGVPRVQAVHDFLRARSTPLKTVLKAIVPKPIRRAARPRIRRANMVKPQMPPAARETLIEGYREDVERLSERLGRDLSVWLRRDHRE